MLFSPTHAYFLQPPPPPLLRGLFLQLFLSYAVWCTFFLRTYVRPFGLCKRSYQKAHSSPPGPHCQVPPHTHTARPTRQATPPASTLSGRAGPLPHPARLPPGQDLHPPPLQLEFQLWNSSFGAEILAFRLQKRSMQPSSRQEESPSISVCYYDL